MKLIYPALTTASLLLIALPSFASTTAIAIDPGLLAQLLILAGVMVALFGCILPIISENNRSWHTSWMSPIFLTPLCWIVGFAMISIGGYIILSIL